MKIFDFDRLIDTLTRYIETKLELFKIEIKEEISTLIAKGLVFMAMSTFVLIGLIFGLGALATWLNEMLESEFAGYLIVFGLMIVLSAFIYLKRSSLESKILDKLIEESSPDQEENE